MDLDPDYQYLVISISLVLEKISCDDDTMNTVAVQRRSLNVCFILVITRSSPNYTIWNNSPQQIGSNLKLSMRNWHNLDGSKRSTHIFPDTGNYETKLGLGLFLVFLVQ